MENFVYHNPTKIIFGKDSMEQIGQQAFHYGSSALILIGKNSVKRSGVYARVISLLNIEHIRHTTFEGIKSNPIYEDADRAVQLAKEIKADMVIAIGGGSVIDTAKAVCMGYYVNHSVWDFYQGKEKPLRALPLLTILTLSATGSEMNQYTVLQDTKNGVKKGFGSTLLYPKVSILDPVLTFTVPRNYTAYGIADLISHCLEVYFGKGTSLLSDHYTASIIRLAIQYAPVVLAEPDNYDARANIMWLATNALNNSLGTGKGGGDWGSHALEHSLSVLYDVPHGAGLSVVFPAWLKYFSRDFPERLAFLGKMVFDIHSGSKKEVAEQFIERLKAFYDSIGTPTQLGQLGITDKDKSLILENFDKNKASGMVYPMNNEAHEAILDNMW